MSDNTAIIEMIAEATSPEEAARLGRRHQRLHPSALRPDWDHAKLQVMLAALRVKVCPLNSCTLAAVSVVNCNMSWHVSGLQMMTSHTFHFVTTAVQQASLHMGILRLECSHCDCPTKHSQAPK